MSATLHHGEPVMIDYTPTAAVTAGDMIAIGTKIAVAHRDIAANELGAISIPGGQSVYKITLATGNSYAQWAAVTVNPATGETNAAAGTAFGYAIAAVDQGNGDTEVIAVLDN